MIRAIVFDCFGVLAHDGWLPFKQKHFGNDPALFEAAGDLNRRVDSGLIKTDDFIPAVAKLANVSAEDAYQHLKQNAANNELFAYIRSELKPNFKLGILSNASENRLPTMFKPDDVALFDQVVLSYQIGTTKPDPRAYQAILDKLEVEAAECVFIDDQERYCTAAQAEGMHAIVYTTFEQLRTDLEDLLAKQLAK